MYGVVENERYPTLAGTDSAYWRSLSRFFGFVGKLVQSDGAANPALRLSFSISTDAPRLR